VVVQGFLGGACACCHWGSEGLRCSFHKSKRRPRASNNNADDVEDTSPSKKARKAVQTTEQTEVSKFHISLMLTKSLTIFLPQDVEMLRAKLRLLRKSLEEEHQTKLQEANNLATKISEVQAGIEELDADKRQMVELKQRLDKGRENAAALLSAGYSILANLEK
jgi:hypothetical protein